MAQCLLEKQNHSSKIHDFISIVVQSYQNCQQSGKTDYVWKNMMTYCLEEKNCCNHYAPVKLFCFQPPPPTPPDSPGFRIKIWVIKKGRHWKMKWRKGRAGHWKIKMKGLKWLIRAGQGSIRVIKRPGQPPKIDVPGGARRGMGAE